MTDFVSMAATAGRWLLRVETTIALAATILVLFFYEPDPGPDHVAQLRGMAIIVFVGSQLVLRIGRWLITRGRGPATPPDERPSSPA